jgi:hypothetical protein
MHIGLNPLAVTEGRSCTEGDERQVNKGANYRFSNAIRRLRPDSKQLRKITILTLNGKSDFDPMRICPSLLSGLLRLGAGLNILKGFLGAGEPIKHV